MKRDTIVAETDPEVLRSQALELLDTNTLLEQENRLLLGRISELVTELAGTRNQDRQQALAAEIRVLQERLDARNRDLFGRRSERRGRPDGEEDGEKKKRKDREKTGRTAQPRLPVQVEVHPLDEADQICPDCGKPLHAWHGQTESSEEVTVIQRKYVLVRHERQKYKCEGCDHIDTALGPDKLMEGGRYSVEFAAHVASEKYAEHAPLERQVTAMARQGLLVSSQTLWDQLHALYLLLLPAYIALQHRVLKNELVHADETSWPVLKPGATKKWWIWVVRDETAVYYSFSPTRGAAAAEQLFGNYAGVVMSDGYPVYTSLEGAADKKGNPKLPNYTLALCWMHARRPFFHAEKNYPAAKEGLDLIAQLYAIEAEARRDAAAGDDLLAARRRLREAKSRGVIAKLDTWQKATLALPGSKLDDGLQYLRNHWTYLTRFLENPRIPLDNGLSERALRGPVLGRKNHQGSRSEAGTRVAALFYSLVDTCKALGLDPQVYLVAAAKAALRDRACVLLPHDLLAQA